MNEDRPQPSEDYVNQAEAEVGSLLDAVGPVDEAAGWERVGAHLAVSFGEDPESREAVIGALERSSDPRAPALVDATNTFAFGPAQDRLNEAAGRVTAQGTAVELPMNFADLTVPAALRTSSKEVDQYLARVERVGDEDDPRIAEVTILTLDQGPGGGPVIRLELSPPVSAEGADRFFTDAVADAEAACEEIEPAGLTDALRSACAENARQEWPLAYQDGTDLRSLAVALSGKPDAFGEPPVDPPSQGIEVGPDEAEDFAEVRDALVDDFMAWLEKEMGADVPDDVQPDLIARAALEWKWRCDGRLTNWTVADLEDFMAGTTSGTVEDGALAEGIPETMLSFFAYLEETDLLYGDPATALIDRCLELGGGDFARTPDPDLSPADALVAQMRAEGGDPGDPEALAAWMENFNSRTFEERDAVLGPALERRAAGSGPPPDGAHRQAAKKKGKRRAQRKAARRARRRSH